MTTSVEQADLAESVAAAAVHQLGQQSVEAAVQRAA